MFENIREDWRTHDCDWTRQGLWVMIVYRFGNWRYGIRNRAIRLPFSFAYKLLKVFSWYDNEWGYSNRMAELARKVGLSL